MLTPKKMKLIEICVLKNDLNAVIKYLGKYGSVHFPETVSIPDNAEIIKIKRLLDRLYFAGSLFNINTEFKPEEIGNDEIVLPSDEDYIIADKICSIIEDIRNHKEKTEQEKINMLETLNEAKAFTNLNAPFSELDQLSYLTLRIGRLDQKGQTILKDTLKDRAIIIPLNDSDDKILAASSRKGRFVLDSGLKKAGFENITVPEDFKGVPSEMLDGLNKQLEKINYSLNHLEKEINNIKENYKNEICRLVSVMNTILTIENLKTRFTETESLYHFTGWTPVEGIKELTDGILKITNGKAAIKIFSPDEVPSVLNGQEKVPVFIKHGAFVKGFESIVSSYGSPLYGTIDPTPIVAFFFTLLFGIMFGDVGQGFVLLLAGLLIKKGPKKLKKFDKFGTPLIAISISSMIFGFLFGTVFANEILLVDITRKITGAITGNPVDRIIPLMPTTESGGSLLKLIYFFGFTLAIGAIIISIGLLLNIINRIILKQYEKAIFCKSGVAGLFLFWYALFIVVHVILGIPFAWFDITFLIIPSLCIFFGPLIWRIISKKKPLLEHGLMTFIMEGFVEILETVSGYVSNTVSFLRVGAFALSHTVLSFIVFTFAELVGHGGGAGTIGAIFIMLFGNVIIIVLEGMIVAIQVMRLQYYEFFSKFFIETGVEFSPFRFNK